jgi:poly(3-hydroxyalkanoate) synthetase
MPSNQAQDVASNRPVRQNVDRWIESLQILAGGWDNPTAEQHAAMATTRNKMLAALVADVVAEAVEAARGEYLHDDTGTPEDEAYNQGVTDAVSAVGALSEGAA